MLLSSGVGGGGGGGGGGCGDENDVFANAGAWGIGGWALFCEDGIGDTVYGFEFENGGGGGGGGGGGTTFSIVIVTSSLCEIGNSTMPDFGRGGGGGGGGGSVVSDLVSGIAKSVVSEV